jgi:5-methylcytosine-specific restriction endonuclease McrA
MLDVISRQIHDLAVEKASKYLVAEAELLSAIIEVDRHRLYEKFDETYLTPYCVKYLKLSDDVAAIFVRVARKSLHVPELEIAVQEGLQITKARTIASVIDTKNKDQWIKKAQTLTKEKLEREVAAANPSASKPERAKPTGPNRIRIEFEVTYEEAELLKRARELMSQKSSKNAQIGETVVIALKEWVNREDPVRKAERAKERKLKSRTNEAKLKTTEPETAIRSSLYRPQGETARAARVKFKVKFRRESQDRSVIPAAIRHQVYLRDRGACRKRMPDGTNCGCKKWTDIHHITPKSYGGMDTLKNLITLCKAHHRQLHARFE